MITVVNDNQDQTQSLVALSKREALKELLKFVLPYCGNELVVNGEFFVRALIFSKIGTDELAASTLISLAQSMTIATVKGTLISTNIFVARNSHVPHQLGHIYRQSLLQAGMASIVSMIFLSCAQPIFDSLKQNPKLSEIAGNYLNWSNLGVPAVLFLQTNQMFLVGIKRPELALCASLVNSLTSLGLGYCAAIGFNDGIRGMAIGTAIANWIAVMAISIYLNSFNSQTKFYKLLIKPDFSKPQYLWKMIRTGIPLGLDSLSTFGSMSIMSLMVGLFGKDSLIAEGVVNQYAGILMSPVMATAMATDVLVGRDISHQRAHNIRTLTAMGLAIGSCISLLSLILLSSASSQLAYPFIGKIDEQNDKIYALIQTLFIIVGVMNLIDTLTKISSGALRGFYDTAMPMIISAILFWAIGLPASYVLAYPINMATNGIFCGRVIASTLTAGFMLYRWQQKSHDPIRAIQAGEAGLLAKFHGVFNRCIHQSPTRDDITTLLNPQQEVQTNTL